MVLTCLLLFEPCSLQLQSVQFPCGFVPPGAGHPTAQLKRPGMRQACKCPALVPAFHQIHQRERREMMLPGILVAGRNAFMHDVAISRSSLSGRAGDQECTGGFQLIPELNPFPPETREAEIVDALMQKLKVDDEQQRQRIEKMKQGTQDWLDARKYRLTASNFGAAAGHNRFRSPEELVQDMLYGEFKGNDATRWGSEKESVALRYPTSLIPGTKSQAP
jgi:YqaJ-like viral recombinase domain